MNTLTIKRKIVSVMLVVFIASNVAVVFNALLLPKPAEAFFGQITVELKSLWQNKDKIIAAALGRVAHNYVDKYVTEFVNKMVTKYKIRNFLYYDQILTNYYLTNYIRDYVDDPELREVLLLLDENLTASESVMAEVRLKIDKYYRKAGGIPSEYVYNPPSYISDAAYFDMAQQYFQNTENGTEQLLIAERARLQAQASTAAKLEIMVGNGLKAGRESEGKCNFPAAEAASGGIPTIGSTSFGYQTRETCVAAKGTWQSNPDYVANLKSLINQPTFEIDKRIQSAIDKIFDIKLDPENAKWTKFGNALGDLLFGSLQLKKAGGVLEEGGTYTPYNLNADVREVDVDKDGIPEGQDANNDNIPDSCYHGGAGTAASPCVNSSTAGYSPYFAPLCQSLDGGGHELQRYLDFVNATVFESRHANTWQDKTVAASSAVEEVISSLESYKNAKYDEAILELGSYVKFAGKIVNSLAEDEDLGFVNNNVTRNMIISNTSEMIKYMGDVRSAITQCENPNPDAIEDVPPPEIDPGVDPGSGGGGSGTGGGGSGGGGGGTTGPAAPNENAVESALRAERVKYGTPISTVEAGLILNAVAWQFRDSGWGLSAKPGGCRGPQPHTGKHIAMDILHYQPTNTLYDTWTSDTGPFDNTYSSSCGPSSTSSYEGEVTFHRTTYHNDPEDRPWVAPVAP